MLEKMGWSEGKGLGAQEDGVREHVKIRLKTNSYGVGAEKKNIRNWLANADGFSELLDRLNSDNGGTPDEKQQQQQQQQSLPSSTLGLGTENANAQSPSPSLESVVPEAETQQPQIARLSHRARFRRMKQMAVRDQKGLQEILGIRSAPTTTAPTPMGADSADESPEATSASAAASEEELSGRTLPLQTISTGVSVTDYFAQKMAGNPALAAIYGHSSNASSTPSTKLPASTDSSDQSDSAHNDMTDSDTAETKSSSKKKKRKSSADVLDKSRKKTKKEKTKGDKKAKAKAKDKSKSKSKSKSKDENMKKDKSKKNRPK
ncbi:hypothetical protein LPJ72_005984 [Coemansia sp. Benny D160-2]|nr:hypothetical protein LPJ72_005984 [Coemansia sp. Benny D160-2]